MGLTSAVRWWEDSQLRVLVLSSLLVQFLLFIFSFCRRFAVPRWVRSMMWLAYLAGDAVAIYALATLFNRQKDQQDRHGGRISTLLELVWAPVLLIHLGGHDGITAYNIEDNELWTRHLLTAVSQVTVAIYVFCKSWPGGDKRLFQAAVVLFVPGVLKCFAKPWALKNASINSLVRSQDDEKARKQNGDALDKYVKQAADFANKQNEQGSTASAEDGAPSSYRGRARESKRSRLDGLGLMREEIHKDESDVASEEIFLSNVDVLEEYVKRGGKGESEVQQGPDTKPSASKLQSEIQRILRGEARKLFVDISSPYHLRLSVLKCFWVLSKENADKAAAYGYVRHGLAVSFLHLYTRLKTTFDPLEAIQSIQDNGTLMFLLRHVILFARMVLPWAAIGLFHGSHREDYNNIDVNITYAILCCTAVLESYSNFAVSLDDAHRGSDGRLLFMNPEQWPEVVAQYSLVGYFARNKKHNVVMWIISKFGCKDFFDQYWWHMRPCFSSGTITDLVLQYLKDGWKVRIHDAASYLRFNKNRGHLALKVHQGLLKDHQDLISKSIERPFDESVLLWHVATEFLFFLDGSSSHRRCAFDEVPTIIWTLLGVSRESGCIKECRGLGVCCKALLCRQMSKYMAYLLFLNPEMLLTGTRRNLFRTACCELEDILEPSLFATTYKKLKGEDKEPGLLTTACKELKRILKDSNRNVKERVIAVITEVMDILRDKEQKEEQLMGTVIITMLENLKKTHAEENRGYEGQSIQGSQVPSMEGSEMETNSSSEKSFIDEAWVLAEALSGLGDDKWMVIEGVWVEMLCFSASRCRGYLHAKALGSGGEFLSYIWLLMSYMGAETLTERLQMEEPPIQKAATTSDGHNGSHASTSEIHTRVAPSTSEIHAVASPSTLKIRIAT